MSDEVWPPPICTACQFLFCDHCRPDPWCEHDCDWLWGTDA